MCSQGAIFEGERNEEALSEFIDKETYEEPVVPAREPPKVSDARIAHIPAWPNKLRLMLVAVYVGNIYPFYLLFESSWLIFLCVCSDHHS